MPLTKFRKLGQEVKGWTIYVWEEGDLVKGFARVVTLDGIDECFVCGREVVRDDEFKYPNKKKDLYIAKSQVKTQLQNTLNALNWYGKSILTNGEIDQDKFQAAEMRAAVSASGIFIDISKTKPVRKFPTKNITFDKAKEWGFL
jgi:hypothetical protein